MAGLAKSVAEGRMRRESRGAWRACSAGDAEFPKTGPRAGGGAERYTAGGDLLFQCSDNNGDTSSLKGNSGRGTPPGDALAHDPFGYGSEINKSTVYMDAGGDGLLHCRILTTTSLCEDPACQLTKQRVCHG